MISCTGLSVVIDGATLLDDVTLAAADGEWVSVLGPNGAGKSTLVRAMAGVVAAEGTIELAGRPMKSFARRERARLLALVPQDPVIPPAVSVTDYVLLGRTPHLPFFATERREDIAVVAGVLARLALEPFADRVVATLSGGERQRVLLARALAQEPRVLLLDEPTTALDIGHQQEVLELVDDLRRTNGLTVVTTMHDLSLAGQYADRLVLLDAGRVVVSGSPDEVLTEDLIRQHYRASVRVVRDGGVVLVIPSRGRAGAVVP